MTEKKKDNHIVILYHLPFLQGREEGKNWG